MKGHDHGLNGLGKALAFVYGPDHPHEDHVTRVSTSVVAQVMIHFIFYYVESSFGAAQMARGRTAATMYYISKAKVIKEGF